MENNQNVVISNQSAIKDNQKVMIKNQGAIQ